MAAKPTPRPAPRSQVVGGHVDSIESADRQVAEIATIINEQAQDQRSVISADLVIGANRLNTGLTRRARGCNLTPTVASAAFAWSFVASGERQAVITVVGAAQPGATLEFY